MVRVTEPGILKELLDRIPQQPPFRFIEGLEYVSETDCKGYHTFSKYADFYRGHFPGNAITPGVILIECAAQIGVLPIGLFMLRHKPPSIFTVYLSQVELEFIKPVHPDERVYVAGTKKYFRKNAIRCAVEMSNSTGEILSLGEITAVIVT